jgi:hypothetical protein
MKSGNKQLYVHLHVLLQPQQSQTLQQKDIEISIDDSEMVANKQKLLLYGKDK